MKKTKKEREGSIFMNAEKKAEASIAALAGRGRGM
jgi:hypothetical protein